jgi:hypothetical protein
VFDSVSVWAGEVGMNLNRILIKSKYVVHGYFVLVFNLFKTVWHESYHILNDSPGIIFSMTAPSCHIRETLEDLQNLTPDGKIWLHTHNL